MVIMLLLLIILNLFITNAASNVVFQSKEAAMRSKAQIVVSAFSGMDAISADGAEQVMQQLEDLNLTRVVIVNNSGKVLFDSSTFQNITGKYALFPEVVEALEGNDIFYCNYTLNAFESRAASPILFRSALIGAVYLMEYDSNRAELIHSLHGDLNQMSIVTAFIVILLSAVVAIVFSNRMRKITRSIKALRTGGNMQKLDIHGTDELGILATEFNKLTDRLEAKEQEQRQFVSDASHELKTPLASIRLLTDSILQNQMDPEMTREFVQDIGNEADRLTRISQKLLTLSKVENQQSPDREICEIDVVISRVLRMLSPLAHSRNILLQLQKSEPCTVLALEDDLHQIIFNLVENGIKYTNDGGAVTISVFEEGEDAVISVADTGIGIPADALSHIFDRFYRVDKDRSRAAGGSGLGLSIVHELVERHYGTISVSSEYQKGTTFTVRFPLFGRWEANE